MKVIVLKTFANSYGKTYKPSMEVLEMWEDNTLFRALADGKLKRYGEKETRVIKPGKIVKTKIKEK